MGLYPLKVVLRVVDLFLITHHETMTIMWTLASLKEWPSCFWCTCTVGSCPVVNRLLGFSCVQIWALLAVLHALCGLACVTVEINQFLSQRKSQIFSTNRTSQCSSEPATPLLFTPQSTLACNIMQLMWNRVIKLKCLIYRIWKTKILTFKPLISVLNLCVHKNVSLMIWKKSFCTFAYRLHVLTYYY